VWGVCVCVGERCEGGQVWTCPQQEGSKECEACDVCERCGMWCRVNVWHVQVLAAEAAGMKQQNRNCPVRTAKPIAQAAASAVTAAARVHGSHLRASPRVSPRHRYVTPCAAGAGANHARVRCRQRPAYASQCIKENYGRERHVRPVAGLAQCGRGVRESRHSAAQWQRLMRAVLQVRNTAGKKDEGSSGR